MRQPLLTGLHSGPVQHSNLSSVDTASASSRYVTISIDTFVACINWARPTGASAEKLSTGQLCTKRIETSAKCCRKACTTPSTTCVHRRRMEQCFRTKHDFQMAKTNQEQIVLLLKAWHHVITLSTQTPLNWILITSPLNKPPVASRQTPAPHTAGSRVSQRRKYLLLL